MKRTILTLVFIVLFLLGLWLLRSSPEQVDSQQSATTAPDTWLINNVLVIDGTGKDAFPGFVRIQGTLIKEVGNIVPGKGETVLDGHGQVLSPGFIDTHSHADKALSNSPGALAAVGQGITTAVIGQDGGIDYKLPPLTEYFASLEKNPVAINIAAYASHNTIRAEVLGNDYQHPSTDAQLEQMQTLLEAEMNAGALGLSTGLEYDPGIYSDQTELIQLAKLVNQYGGRYISHLRSEDRWFFEALEEIIAIGRESGVPVQISHLKLAMKSLWGRAPEILAMLDKARAEGIDITADIYPYEYWQSFLYVLVPDRDPDNLAEIQFALDELAPPEKMILAQFDPEPSLEGQTFTDIAAGRGETVVETFSALLRLAQSQNELIGDHVDKIIATSMTEEDIIALLNWPHTNICTDGELNGSHPRGAGSFPRVLGRYVRELGALPLETAVHKMTGLSAQHMGIKDRGLVAPGMAADLVLFDPETVIDNATTSDPAALNTGITSVWVNGELVFENGAVTGTHPGVIVRR